MARSKSSKTDPRKRPTKIDDFRTLAAARIPPHIFDYIDCGACDEISSVANERDMEEIHLLPLCLRDVSELDLSVRFLGNCFSFPIGFSPTAFHRLVHDAGEVSPAKAAATLNIPMIVSAMSSITLEDVARYSGNEHLWFQTYIFKDRDVTRELIDRAEKSGSDCGTSTQHAIA